MVKRKQDSDHISDDSDIDIIEKKKRTKPENGTSPITSKNHVSLTSEEIKWPTKDILALLKLIVAQIPKDDTLNHRTRLERIHWPSIRFGDYTSLDCYNTWSQLLAKTRKFRTLTEIVGEIQEWIDQPQPCSINEVVSLVSGRTNIFWYFCLDKKDQITSKYPDISEDALKEVLMKMYSRLTSSERNKYGAMARKQRQNQGKVQKELKKKQKKQPNQPPKKPRTPYKIFLHYALQNHPKTAKSELLKKWKQLSAKDKFFYIKWSEEELAVYKKDLETYMSTHPRYKPPQVKIHSAESRKIRDKILRKPARPPRSAYCYLVKLVAELGRLGPPQSLVVPKAVWRAYSHKEREQLHARLMQLWDDYEAKFERYLLNFPLAERVQIKANEGHFHFRPKRQKSVLEVSVGPVRRPVEPPKSVYRYFMELHKGEEVDLEAKWRGLDEGERERLAQELEAARNRWVGQIAKYLSGLSKEELEEFRMMGGREGSDVSEEEEEEESGSDSDESEEF